VTFADKGVAILEPYVGRIVADTCIRGSAIAAGKTPETLGAEDLPAVEQHVRSLLGLVVPSHKLDEIVDELRRAAA
jgi:hypothetical protein